MQRIAEPLLFIAVAMTCSVSALALAENQNEAPAASQADAARSTSSMTGRWKGEISIPGAPLAISVELKSDHTPADADETGTALVGSIDIPVQGLKGFALSEIVCGDDSVSFKLPGIPGNPRFEGTLDAAGSGLAGEFKRGGATFPCKLTRADQQEIPSAESANGVPGDGLVGHWQGTLRVQVFELRIVLHVEEENGVLSATLDSPDQSVSGIEVSRIDLSDSAVSFEVTKIGGRYKGVLNEDGSEIAGEWSQLNQNMPLVLKRTATAPEMVRPQEPHPPFPYHSTEVEFRNAEAEVDLSGTLTVPKTPGPHPAVVLVSGSGPQDRDEAIMGHRPFLILADHLTRQGIAVLRYDDRGFGKSTGDFLASSVTDFTNDAAAAVAFLRRQESIDPDHVGVIGHSEGAIVAGRLAAASSSVGFIVLMAGPGVPLDDLLRRQAEDLLASMEASQESAALQLRIQDEVLSIAVEYANTEELESRVSDYFDSVESSLTDEQKKSMDYDCEAVERQFKTLTSAWFRELITIDPQAILRDVACPVLAVNGAKDIQVAAEPNIAAIKAALDAAGNRNATVVTLPDLNHLFQTCKTGAVGEYAKIDETMSPKVLTLISDWILKAVAESE